MTDSWKINKWKENLTPKRAIQNFFLHATPVDSPNPDELVQLFPGLTSESHEDGTPVAGSSQSGQLGNLKRKREKSQQLEGNVSKKKILDETEIFPDSAFDKTELPSQLESPSIGIPPRPGIKNKKRMSTNSFTQAIQSQQSQKSKEAEFEDFLDESSIPSGIGSPNEPISQRPGKSKARVSTSVFTKSLAEKNVQEKIEDTASISAASSSTLETAEIPSNLDSPEKIYSQRVGISKAKRRVSSTGYKDILDKSGSKRIQLETSMSQERSSPEISFPLESPDQIHSQRPVVSKERKRVSSTGFSNVLNTIDSKQNQFESSASSTNSSLEASASDAEDKPASMSSFSKKSEKVDLVKQGKPNESLEEITPKTSIVNLPARKSKSRRSDRQVHGKDKTSEVSQQLSEVLSSEKSPEVLKKPVSDLRKHSITPANVTRSSLAKSSRIESIIDSPVTQSPGIPSTLGSPDQIPSQRPVISKERKRVSSTGFKDVLDKFNLKQNRIASSSSSENSSLESTSASDAEESPLRNPSRRSEETLPSDSRTSEKADLVKKGKPNAKEITLETSPVNLPARKSKSRKSDRQDHGKDKTLKVSQNLPLSPQKEKSIADSSPGSLSSDISSKLDSPVEVKDYSRPSPVSSRKQVSMTGNLPAVNQESIHLSSSEPESSKANLPETPKFQEPNIDPSVHDTHQRTPKLLVEEQSKSSPKTPASKVLVEEKAGLHKTLTPVVKELGRSLRRSQIPGLKKELRKSSRKNLTLTQLDEKEDEFPPNSSQVSNKPIESSASTATLPPMKSVHSKTSKEPSGSLLSKTIVQPGETTVISSSSSSDMAVNRSQKSLKSVTLSGKSVSEEIVTPNEEPLPVAETEVEETPPSDYESGEERDDPATPGFSSESNRSSTKSVKTAMSPTNRYPALKNSTVVAGGAPFLGEPLSMSPIRLSEKETPLTVPSTPTTPKLTRKPIRSVAQSPMFLNVMQKSISKSVLKADPKHSDASIHTSPSLPPLSSASLTPTSIFPDASSGTKSKFLTTPPPLIPSSSTPSSKTAASSTPASKTATSSTPTSSSVVKSKTFSSSKNVFGAKKSSLSNLGKGKSLAQSKLDEIPDESSDTEWEDLERDLKVKPLSIKIAFEDIEDRSKDYVPLEERLKNDPIFQAKVKNQRARLAAQKAVEEAEVAKKKLTQTKSRVVAKKKTPKDNIASAAINKANLRFYATTKVSKEALESVHDLVGEWFDFTIDQMESFCHDEGKAGLETWEDCFKMLKRQKIVKNYADYSGLCHELLLNDECAKLLPTEFPPDHYERKREAKRQTR